MKISRKANKYKQKPSKYAVAKIDMKDRRLLSEMDMDAKAPMKALARRCRLSRQVADYRLRRLREQGVAFGALTIFDSAVAGYKWYRVLLSLNKISVGQKGDLLGYLKNHRFVFWLGEVGGNWDIVVNFVCRDHFHFNSIFEEMMQKHGQFVKRHEILIYIDVHDMPRAYLLPTDSPRMEFYHAMKPNSSLVLDNVDKGIIRILGKDASASATYISEKIGASPQTVNARVAKMLLAKFILGFRLFINPSALGYQSHMVFFEMNRIEPESEKTFVNYLKGVPNVTFIVRHLGKWRIGLEIETRTQEEFQDIFVRIRTKFAGLIDGFESFPLFRDHVIDYFPEGNFD